MNNAERISALEGLLARIQKNAALPRPPRAHSVVQVAPAAHKAAAVAPAAQAAPKAIVAVEPRIIAVVARCPS